MRKIPYLTVPKSTYSTYNAKTDPTMKKTFLLLCTAATIVSCNARPAPRELPEQVTLTKERLLDKIKGGWARLSDAPTAARRNSNSTAR